MQQSIGSYLPQNRHNIRKTLCKVSWTEGIVRNTGHENLRDPGARSVKNNEKQVSASRTRANNQYTDIRILWYTT